MSKTLRLVKNYFLNFIGSFISKKQNARFFVGGVFVALISGLMIFIFTNMAITSTIEYNKLGFPIAGMLQNVMMALIIMLFLTVMRSAMPSNTTDEQRLLALPIKKYHIILAKSLFNYLFDFFSLIGILLPAFIVYVVINQASSLIAFRGLLIITFIPLFSNALASFIAIFFQKLSSSFRSYHIIQTILILLLIIAYLFSSYALNNYLMNGGSDGIEKLMNNVLPIKWILNFVLFGNLGSIIWIGLISLGSYTISIILKSHLFGREIKSYRSKKTDLDFSQKSPLRALFTKEIKYYFSVPIYVLNTIVGVIIFIGLSVSLLFIDIAQIEAIIATSLNLTGMTLYLILAVGCATLTTCATTASTISLEGKRLWILKANPIKIKDIFAAKILLQLLLTIIPIILMAPIYGYIFGWINIWLFIVIPSLASFLIAIVGLYFNLLFPKLEWESETVPVKQGLSILVTLFFGLVFVILPFVLYFAFLHNIIPGYFNLFLIVYFVLFILLSIGILNKKGSLLFKQLS